MLGRFIAILTFRRRTECLTGRAKVIDGDTIVVADQLVRLHGIDAPELDPDVLVVGPANSVRHDVVRRPGGAHSRGQGALPHDRLHRRFWGRLIHAGAAAPVTRHTGCTNLRFRVPRWQTQADINMASQARASFDKNAADIERLLELHAQAGGTAPGRRYNLEVLNKSAIVLITAFWEAYCEDVAAEGLEHIVRHAKSAEALPLELKKQVCKDLKNEKNEIEIWSIADSGWRQYLQERFDEMRGQRNRRLNTPKTENINELFRHAVGIERVSDNWKWPKKMTCKRASDKLDKFIELRGAIAHRGKYLAGVKKSQVTDYFDFVKSLAAKTGRAVNLHVRKVTGRPLWTK